MYLWKIQPLSCMGAAEGLADVQAALVVLTQLTQNYLPCASRQVESAVSVPVLSSPSICCNCMALLYNDISTISINLA